MKLVGWLNQYRRVPKQVVAGDFNEIPTGLAIQYMKQSFRSAYADVHGREPLATFPTALVRRQDDWTGCLDYFFCHRRLRQPRPCPFFAINLPMTIIPYTHLIMLV